MPTILVKTVGTIRAFPPPPITMLIFHGLQNQDPFIDPWHVSTLPGGRGAQKRQRKKNTRGSYNDGSMYSKFSTFRPNLTSVPKCFDPDCSNDLEKCNGVIGDAYQAFP